MADWNDYNDWLRGWLHTHPVKAPSQNYERPQNITRSIYKPVINQDQDSGWTEKHIKDWEVNESILSNIQ